MSKRFCLAVAAGVLTSLPLTAAAAVAVDLDAPYARAAAKVSAAGLLTSGKNVESAQRVGTGRYCVRVNSGVPLRNSVIMGTPNSGTQSTLDVRRAPTPVCNNDARSITVFTYNAGVLTDTWFTVAVL
ncbi:hypothetical protein ACFYT4_14660 [Streptomyces sp. NPDC004609]|uniref:hypothetical protein n=1 Tax=Streptomyces sp. NPDC004609 TaxID=3364704 RepID=UPI00369D6B08